MKGIAMNKGNRIIRRFAVRFAAVAIASAAMSASAGVCKIGNTEYDTLQEAFNSKTSASADFTVTLLQDIDVRSEIDVPKFNKKRCTVDGAGHTIRQAYAGRVFNTRQGQDFTHITFKDVTILGGGEECSTVDQQLFGTVFRTFNGASSLTLDSGCVISNFVSYGTLIGEDSNYANWSIYVNPGVVIACNRITCDMYGTNNNTFNGGIFRLGTLGNSYALYIRGGEFFGNHAQRAVIACFTALNEGRTKPILVISGGNFHDNVADMSNKAEGALFYFDYGPMDANMTGGEIHDNECDGFYIRRGASYQSRVHISGGKIFGNAGYAVFDLNYGDTAEGTPCSMFLSGDALVGGNGENGTSGLQENNEQRGSARTVLEGDFTGFASLSGQNKPAYRNIGVVYGTNLASYAGAENIHQAGARIGERVLALESDTGYLKWQEPKSAKIGADEYDTLALALSAATDGATIELMRDCVMTASIVPPANKAITIDGAGYRIFRCMKDPLVKATAAGGDMTFTNVELNEGYFTSRDSYTNHVDGAIVCTADGVAATVTLGSGTVLSGGRGTNALVRVANGATVNLDGCVITGAVNRAVAASSGGTLGVKGATLVKDNAGGDIDVEDGNILALNGNLTGSLHVTVAGAEAFDGQKFGTKTGDWTGEENFINGGNDPKLHVSTRGILAWCRRGTMMIFR